MLRSKDMRRNYEEIDKLIVAYVINILQEHSTDYLYNEMICRDLNITRHVLYNHFDNIDVIYDKILETAESVASQIIDVDLPTEEYIIYSANFIFEHNELFIAAIKVKTDFFKQFYTKKQKKLHEEYLKSDNIPYKKHLEAFQISGLLGLLNEIKTIKTKEELQEIIDSILFIYRSENEYFKINKN